MRDEFIKLTSDLIRCRSTAFRPDDINRCADMLSAWLAAHGIAHQRTDRNGVPSICVSGPEKRAPFTLLCHFDVVDGSDAAFIPRYANGVLSGRGSGDDKYACALALLLYRDQLAELRALGKGQADMPVMLLLTGDEEIGGHNGAEALAGELDTEFCMALDSSPHTALTVKQKGYLRLRLACRGTTAHGAYPWMGENAILALARDCLALEALFASEQGVSPEDAETHWLPTCTVARIQGGSSVNQVPDAAFADLDVRYTERDDPDALLERMRRCVSGALEETQPRGLPVTAGDSPWLSRLLRHMPGVVPGFAHGACDTRHFSPRGIPCVSWGADNENSAHMESEHLLVESAMVVYSMLDSFVRDLRG